MAGAVILVRHGEPALSRRVLLTAAGYRDWWARYEEGGLLPGQAPPPKLTALFGAVTTILSSSRERARETAQVLAAERPFRADALFIEAPLPSPPLPSWIRLSPRWWGVVSRFWWQAFNYHDGQESFAEAKARAERAATLLSELTESGDTVALIAQGYFNYMIGRALIARGWRRVLDQGFQYWAARRFEPPPPPALRPAAQVG